MIITGASIVAQWSRICLPIQETWFWSLVWEDPLEKEMTTQSSILAWEIPWIEEPGGLQSMGSQRSQTQFSDQTITTKYSRTHEIFPCSLVSS